MLFLGIRQIETRKFMKNETALLKMLSESSVKVVSEVSRSKAYLKSSAQAE